MLTSIFNSTFLFLCRLFALFFTTLFLIAPTRSFQQWLGSNKALNYYPFSLFMSAFACLICYVLYKIFSFSRSEKLSWSHSVSDHAHSFKMEWKSVFSWQMLLCLGILVQVLFQVNFPLHWEDNYHLSTVVQDPLLRINPFKHTSYHALSNLTSYLSIHLFGVSQWSIKLPALIFTSIFLICISMLFRTTLSPFTQFLLLAHFTTNQFALWFMHSMRGYIASMLVTAICLWLLLQITSEKNTSKNRFYFGVLCFFSCLSVSVHMFASFFCLVLFMSYAFWIWIHKKTSQISLNLHRKFLSSWILYILPVLFMMLVIQVLFLSRHGDFFWGKPPEMSQTLLQTLGLSSAWQGKILFLLFVISLSYVFKIKAGAFRNKILFLSIFLFTTVLFMSGVIFSLELFSIESRFLLPFILPVIALLGESISALSYKKIKYTVMGVSIFILVICPLFTRKAQYDFLTLNVRDFNQFINKVRETTNPNHNICYSFSGEPNLVLFSKTLYFGALQNVTNEENTCTSFYHLYYKSAPGLEPLQTTPIFISKYTYDEVYNLDNRMILYRKYPTPESKRVFGRDS